MASVRFGLLAGSLAVVTYAVFAIIGGGAGLDGFFKDWVYTGVEVLALALVVVRVVRVRASRLAWALIAASLLLWATADLLWTVWLNDVADPPFPGIADWLYYLSYVPLYAGMVLLIRGSADSTRAFWLDGLVAGFAAAALAAALVLEPVRQANQGSSVAIWAVTYPVLDAALIGVVMVAFGAAGWRPGRMWLWLGMGQLLNAVADGVYAYQEAVGTYHPGTILDAAWPAAFMMTAFAAWQPVRARRQTDQLDRRVVAIPAGFAVVALGLLVVGQDKPIGLLAGVLAAAAIVAAGARAALTYLENRRLLSASLVEARQDALSGLPNRRALLDDLNDACHDGVATTPRVLAFFDLDGFKNYNDSFGHAAGDVLLRRLSLRLSRTVADQARVYRLGGDEFCMLTHDRSTLGELLLDHAVQALTEDGEGFHVRPSCGVVHIPSETTNAVDALRLADQRMYAEKNSREGSSRHQTRDVLVALVDEADPSLREHAHDVARLCHAVGTELGLSTPELDTLVKAAELHDIGKIAIPDQIRSKPSPLDDDEWALMHQHPVIGERILAVAAAMRPVAALVRSSHERWDGTGYPDRLAGQEIPLGARIIAVCDSYDAIVTDRPYSPAESPSAALDELQRHAGNQFDPTIVAALRATLHTLDDDRADSASTAPILLAD